MASTKRMPKRCMSWGSRMHLNTRWSTKQWVPWCQAKVYWMQPASPRNAFSSFMCEVSSGRSTAVTSKQLRRRIGSASKREHNKRVPLNFLRNFTSRSLTTVVASSPASSSSAGSAVPFNHAIIGRSVLQNIPLRMPRNVKHKSVVRHRLENSPIELTHENHLRMVTLAPFFSKSAPDDKVSQMAWMCSWVPRPAPMSWRVGNH